MIFIAIFLELSVATETLYHVKIEFPSHNDSIAPGFISPRVSVTRKFNHLIDINFKFCATISDSVETSSSCLPLRQTTQLGEFYFSREKRSQIKVYVTDEQKNIVSNVDVCEFTVARSAIPSRVNDQILQSSPNSCQSDGRNFRWKVPGVVNPMGVNLCTNTFCVPVRYINGFFTGVIDKKWTRVVARWMWRDLPWYQQVSRSVKEFEWEGCVVDKNFVNLVVCEWEQIKDEETFFDRDLLTLYDSAKCEALKTGGNEQQTFEVEYWVGDSTMKRLMDARVRECSTILQPYEFGKLHNDSYVNCDNSRIYYIWSAGFDDTATQLDMLPKSKHCLLVTNAGHNYINMNDRDFSVMIQGISDAMKLFSYAIFVGPPAMNTSYWFPKKRCARNNVIVQRRIKQMRSVIKTSHFVDIFWSTLGSPLITDGVHYQGVVYEKALCDVYTKALILKMHSMGHNDSLQNLSQHRHDNFISGVSGKIFSGTRIRTFFQREPPPKIKLVRTDPICSHWAVVTTINAPTLAIHSVINQPKFCVVIVADLKTPTKEYFELESEKIHFLSVQKQEDMGEMEIVNELPWNHFGRKNIGYLYAIQHGATVVFDFDDDNVLISDIPSITPQSWLVADNSGVFNPYPMFVHLNDVAWPRGFPLTQIQNASTWKEPTLITDNASIGVVQSLANHDPDMDAIWRLTRKLPLNFDEKKRVLLSSGTFCSYNAQATLHYALWGMMLPVSVHGRVSDIWRSYIMQRLMHDVGQVVGFVSPFVKQVRNAHNYQGDFMSERPLYEKAEALVKMLAQWKGRSQKFEERFVELFVELYERDFIEIKDVYLAQKWVRSLKQMIYQFPQIIEISKSKLLSRQIKPYPQRIPRLKHFLVTGGAGYIGAHASAYLLEEGHSVTVVDNLSRGSKTSISIFSEAFPSRFRFHNIDIGNAKQLDELFVKYSYDAVWHFAAVAFIKESVENPALYHQNITVNTHTLATTMRRHGVPELIFSSSCAVYGVPDSIPVTEETPTNPLNPYGKAKLAAENMLKKMSTSTFKVRILRYFNVVGAHPIISIGETPHPGLKTYGRLWTACVDAIEGRQPGISIRGNNFDTVDGTGIRDFVHVWDLVRAHLSVMEAPGHFSLYNVATGIPTTIKQFVDACETVSEVKLQIDTYHRRHMIRPSCMPILQNFFVI